MFIGDVKGPVKVPERMAEPPKEGNLKVEKGDDSPNFERLISESNFEKQAELEKEKAAAGGDFKLGENKSDREFRQQLEKVTGKKQDKAKNKLERDDYLNLLVTQLKYQDPSKPMEHFEMASQMAQFNTVEQLMGVNKVLTEMKKMQNDNKAEKLTQYLGKDIELQGDKIKLTTDGKISLAKFEIETQAGNTVVEIRDEQAKLVRSIPLGPKQAGVHKITWDGLNDKSVPQQPGNYSFNVLASTDEGKHLSTKLSYVAHVEGITEILTGGKLDTNLGSADPAKIVAIRNPEEVLKAAKPLNPYAQRTNKDPSLLNNDNPLNKNNPQNIIQNAQINPPQMDAQIMPPQMQNMPRQSPKPVDNSGPKEVFTSQNSSASHPAPQSKSAEITPKISQQHYGGPPPVAGINGRSI